MTTIICITGVYIPAISLSAAARGVILTRVCSSLYDAHSIIRRSAHLVHHWLHTLLQAGSGDRADVGCTRTGGLLLSFSCRLRVIVWLYAVVTADNSMSGAHISTRLLAGIIVVAVIPSSQMVLGKPR